MKTDAGLQFIIPDWPAPARVRAVSTTRAGGYSLPPYSELNLALHVGDDPSLVQQNRARLAQALALPAEPVWLNQVHGTGVIDAALANVSEAATQGIEADAIYATRADTVCAVMTADCLPLLLCDQAGTCVAAVHAGWRGLAGGVIEAAIAKLPKPASELMAWLGPAIGPQAFEVGAEVREVFVNNNAEAVSAFVSFHSDRWLADIYKLARLRLAACSIERMYGGQYCTYSDAERFYSYRRDGVTGRMASLIWLVPQSEKEELRLGSWQTKSGSEPA